MMEKVQRLYQYRENAFTLVEIMVAVSILALIAVVAFAVVFGAVKRSRHIDRELELQIETSVILNLVAEDIRSAFQQDSAAPYFIGKDAFSRDKPSDGIALLTTAVLPISPILSSGSVGEVEYFVEEDGDGNLVFMRREQSPVSAPFDEGGDVYEVTNRLESFNLSYSDGEDWFDEWDSQSETGTNGGKLPSKVRVEVTLKEGETVVTYRTTVAPVMAVGR